MTEGVHPVMNGSMNVLLFPQEIQDGELGLFFPSTVVSGQGTEVRKCKKLNIVHHWREF